MSIAQATNRQVPKRVKYHAKPTLRDVRGYIPADGPHGRELLDWLIGKTAYMSAASLGEFDAVLSFLPAKTLSGLWARNLVKFGDYQLRYSGDRLDAWLSVRRGNQYGVLINARRLVGKQNTAQGIERQIERAMRLFERHNLPYGDFRSSGNVAALIMSAWAGPSHLPPPEHLEMHWNAFRGARFEVTTLGQIPECYDYDISSAYPAQMAKLTSTLPMAWSFSDDLDEILSADYAAALCDITIPSGCNRGSIAIRVGQSALFWPVGQIKNAWLSLSEIDALRRYSLARVSIVGNASIGKRVRGRVSRPYNGSVQRLYKLRASEFGAYIKQVMVCMYGKLVGEYNGVANSHWNPVYASHITAALRMQTWKMAQRSNVYGEFADGVAVDKPLETSPGIGGVREEGRGPMLMVTDLFKQSDWKRPFSDLRGYMEAQRDAHAVTVQVRRAVGLGSVAQNLRSPSELGNVERVPFEFPIGSTTRVCSTPGLQNYDLLDGMIETRAPTMADIPGLMLSRSIKQPRFIDEYVPW